MFQPGTRRSGRLIGFPNAHISDFRSRAKRRGMPLPRAPCLRFRERGSPRRQNVKAGCPPRASLEGGQSPPSQWRTASPSRPTAWANARGACSQAQQAAMAPGGNTELAPCHTQGSSPHRASLAGAPRSPERRHGADPLRNTAARPQAGRARCNGASWGAR